ncbi:Beta-barrel assembly machine subunit BamB [Azomonas agilis]|uniref:Outer membrane protein assembly factor BamB n=1 Tax=Azomonas agilis TaxID=116849 RepID=A0A562J1K3_9GAMM|nr:outer membrane protein assembly factor BamB [Azomonas agilis]TWH76695.1 Beta-barrel assembly machine subunit BamB [Azomonas agilis]
MPNRICALLWIILASFSLGGCGLIETASDTVNSLFNSDANEPEPAPLPEFKPEVELVDRWSARVGVGQGKTYNQLVPAVYGNEIFAADVEGFVIALDRFSGDEKWSRETLEPISGGVGVGFGLVLFGTLKGEVVALDVDNGTEKWRAKVDGEVLSPPSVNGDIVLIQTQNDNLVALDIDTGRKRWSYENTPAVLTLRGTSTPLLTNSFALAGLSSGKIIALDTQRGFPIWEQRIAIPQGRSELERVVDIDGDMLLSAGVLYAVSYQGRVAAMDVQSGRILWQKDASSYRGIAKGYGSLYLSLADGQIQSIDERTTTVLWSNKALERRQLSAPVVFSSYIAVGDKEGYLHLLSQIDGRFVARLEINESGWQFVPTSGVRVAPVVDGDWLYSYGNDGSLIALTLKSKDE